MLFLFSEAGEADAPTRIRVGSHLDVPRPRFMAQPPLMSAVPHEPERADADYSALEFAIRRGLARED